MDEERSRQGTIRDGDAPSTSRKWARAPAPKETFVARGRTAASRWLDTRIGEALERDAVPLLALLRRLKPVVTTPRFTLVLRNDDTRDVLADPDAFTVGLYTPKMDRILKGFALAVDDPVAHAASRAILGHAFLAGDIERLAARTATLAAEAVDGTTGLDVVGDLARPVLGTVAAEHLGIAASDPARLAGWCQAVFRDVFLNPVGDEAVARRADDALAALSKAAATGPPTAPDGTATVRARLQATATLDPEAVAANLVAMALAWVPNTLKSFPLALAELLGRPTELAAAREAALGGEDARLAGYLREALRFRPPLPGIPRLCVRDRDVGGTVIRAGTAVLAMTKSAMRDGRAVVDPRRFSPERPLADYLNHGFGQHTCVGAAVSTAQLAALARPVLARAPSAAGRLRWDGPYPSRLAVRFRD